MRVLRLAPVFPSTSPDPVSVAIIFNFFFEHYGNSDAYLQMVKISKMTEGVLHWGWNFKQHTCGMNYDVILK